MNNKPQSINESIIEQTVLAWFESLCYSVKFGPDISPDGLAREREDYDQVVLLGRLQPALENINPNIPVTAFGDALRKIVLSESPSLIENNRHSSHWVLTNDVDVEVVSEDDYGSMRYVEEAGA